MTEEKKKNDNQSRRKFLKAGTIAAASSIIAIKASAATEPNKEISKTGSAPAPLTGSDPASAKAYRTTGHKIVSNSNIDNLGTDTYTVQEFSFSGTDITSALNSAIGYLNTSGSYGGQILIPQGVWETDGNHELKDSISVEGVGLSVNGGRGTQINLKTTSSAACVFKITGTRVNCSLKNMMVNLISSTGTPRAIGLWITNSPSNIVYHTAVENVDFNYGEFGIKVESTTGNFECIMNRFEKVYFLGCTTGFYCNSVNGGYTFDNCYFAQLSNSIALDLVYMGNISLDHCLFVGGEGSSGNTILRTYGVFNNISFFDCQDEGIEYMYKNYTNYYLDVPLVYRNCLIQSKFKFTASGSVIFDSCRVNITGTTATNPLITDVAGSPGVKVYAYLKGSTTLISLYSTDRLVNFQSNYSRLYKEFNEIDEPFIASSAQPYYVSNASRGVIIIPSGSQSRTVYNYPAGPDSVILTQLLSYDSGGARIREVVRNTNYFIINLDKNAAADLSIAYKVESYLV